MGIDGSADLLVRLAPALHQLGTAAIAGLAAWKAIASGRWRCATSDLSYWPVTTMPYALHSATAAHTALIFVTVARIILEENWPKASMPGLSSRDDVDHPAIASIILRGGACAQNF